MLFVSAILFAQNQRFIYDYKFQSDSTNTENVKSELMYLDVTTTESKYYSYDTYQQDSIRRADFEKQIQATGAMNVVAAPARRGFVRYSVTKTYPDFKTFMKTNVGTDSYKVFDENTQNWQIKAENRKLVNSKHKKLPLISKDENGRLGSSLKSQFRMGHTSFVDFLD